MHFTISQITDYIGLLGVIMTLIAYYLLNVNKLASTDLSYLLMNFFGSVGVVISLWIHWNLSAMMLETIWAMISLLGIYRVLVLHKQSKYRK